MGKFSTHLHIGPCLRAGAMIFSLGALAAVAATDFPPLKKGMWEFKRTVDSQGAGAKPANLANQKCTDPAADMRRMNESMTKQGCKISPVSNKGNAYSFTSECQMQGVSIQSQSVITVESDSAYTTQVNSSAGGRSTKELLVAKRVGDC
jgi:hypothetical protein